MRAIHQITAGFSRGDAISNEVRVWRDVFKSWGFSAELFCEIRRILPELRKEARDLAGLPAAVQPDDVVVLHLSMGSPANEVFKQLKCRKVIQYHNVTTPDFFRGYQEEVVTQLRRGLEQVQSLANVAEVTLAASAFNAAELTKMGYRDVRVMPLMLDRSQWEGPADRRILAQYEGGPNVLFVGRCAPNKRWEDLLHAFYFFQKSIGPDARLLLVGSYTGMERYQAMLFARAKELGLKNVVFAGSVRQDELRAYYRAAHLFLCMSEHEGFCIPVLEAMANKVPVMAFAAGAVPETMDGAGILFSEKRMDAIAEMMARVCKDAVLREALLKKETDRLQRYFAQNLPALLRRYLEPLLTT